MPDLPVDIEEDAHYEECRVRVITEVGIVHSAAWPVSKRKKIGVALDCSQVPWLGYAKRELRKLNPDTPVTCLGCLTKSGAMFDHHDVPM